MKRISVLFLITILFSACNMPSGPAASSPTPDAIATQVSQLLTEIPTATQPNVEPTASQTPTLTATATAALPTPTQTSLPPTSTDTPDSVLGPPNWKDTLDSGNAFYKYENENTRVTQENGRLILSGITSNGWLGWSMTFSRKPTDFQIEATFIPQTCSGSDIYGLLFRAPNTSAGYFFGVTCDGRYNLHMRDFENDVDTVLINLTSGAGIQTGSNVTNRLAVKAVGNTIGLYANDTLLQETTDSTFSSGNFGAFVAANETPGFTVWMEEISLWDLP